MIDLIDPFILNGRRYTRLDGEFTELLVLFGRAHVVEALDHFGQSPADYNPASVRSYCQWIEDSYC
jgi:hypothetical protein